MNSKARSSSVRAERGPSESTPLTLGTMRAGRPRWRFRLVDLNAAGWSAVLGPGALLGSGIGFLTSRKHPGRVAVLGAAGAVTGLLVARAVDEMRWRETSVALRIDEPDEALDVMQAVRAAGVHADMVRSAGSDPGDGRLTYEIRYRARDERRVRAVLFTQPR